MQNTYRPNSPIPQGSGAEEFSSNLDESLLANLRRCLYALAGLTLFLMALGSATRVMNAGLACPDWPLCYGEFVPSAQMNLQVFLEWFHRLVASTVGFCTIALVGVSWWFRKSVPNWLPWAALAALALVVFQGVLGGLTVIELLRFDIVTAHLGTGLLFFSLVLAIAVGLTPLQTTTVAAHLPWLGLTATLLVYLQSLLGALVASQWALHLCFSESELCGVMNAHLLGIIPASLAALTVAIATWLTPDKTPLLDRLSQLAGLLLATQLAVGSATFRLHLQVEPLTVTHQAVGAALLGTLLAYTLVAWRSRAATRSTESPA
ncbi:heme A synthase [Synechococcus sp. PCC 7336]|uniref:COX15/CtaA family protein n=1 Tax=Synechococcus sp. PCC 7336 TaxID=195250 RepID=UPI0003472AC9|nr:heme A synthase [Synechococcus sp. PCC 7336]